MKYLVRLTEERISIFASTTFKFLENIANVD